MVIEQMGYRVSGLPSQGVITVQPDPALNPPVQVCIVLVAGADEIVYGLAEAKAIRDALDHAVRLADQIADSLPKE